ncbi:chemotaxis protein CheR [Nibrella saemangeumensis]|uniref:Chemotaxis protein CheR n=1 Tax=Nibrella saemangeumensis TaxID=1084526 RepID=A0ABP8NPE3_9BACT
MSSQHEINPEELNAIIDLIRLQYGYDFSDYAPASFRRRIARCMSTAGIKTAYDLKFHLLNDKPFFGWFLQSITVNVTEMFRDPAFYKMLREQVLPTLASYPVLKIWHAGCATGEEVFSMAILLQEEGLLRRTRIYATDLNPANLERARTGIVPLQHMRDYTFNYIQSGGKNEFSSYYTARYENAIIDKELRQNILFSPHNLVTDQVFNEFQLICCRNVLIYFNKVLQNRVIHLFYDSLSPLGYLAIGMKESLLFSDIRDRFDVVSATTKVFRRKM